MQTTAARLARLEFTLATLEQITMSTPDPANPANYAEPDDGLGLARGPKYDTLYLTREQLLETIKDAPRGARFRIWASMTAHYTETFEEREIPGGLYGSIDVSRKQAAEFAGMAFNVHARKGGRMHVMVYETWRDGAGLYVLG